MKKLIVLTLVIVLAVALGLAMFSCAVTNGPVEEPGYENGQNGGNETGGETGSGGGQTGGGNNNNNNNNNGGNGGNGIPLSTTMFDGFRVVLGNSTALGIMAPTSVQPVGIAGLSLTRNQNGDDIVSGRNTMVGIDGNGNEVEIIFEEIEPNNGEHEIITQYDINAQFGKLYVTAEFIYFTLTTLESGYIYDDYHQTNFRSNVYTQTFLIDLATYNVYSLAVFPHIYRIDGRFIWINNDNAGHSRVYELAILQDHITYTLLNPSPDLILNNFFVDRSDNVFLVVEGLVLEYEIHPFFPHVIFVRDFRNYGLDEERNVYRFVERFFHSPDRIIIQVQVWYNSTWASPQSSKFNIFWRDNNLQHNVRGGIVVRDSIAFTQGVSGSFQPMSVTFESNWMELRFQNHNYSFSPMFFLGANGEFVLREENGRLYFLDTSNFEYSFVTIGYGIFLTFEWTQFLTHRNHLLLEDWFLSDGLSVIAIHQGVLGTIRYYIYVSERGALEYLLESEIEFDTRVIVLWPINR